ncbi:hypothetical protein HYV86_01295 [Candidatus Woesearchaeota archaeon]|nr:hypothetical protein [Candidatus Woesearchaeota archaeon]
MYHASRITAEIEKTIGPLNQRGVYCNLRLGPKPGRVAGDGLEWTVVGEHPETKSSAFASVTYNPHDNAFTVLAGGYHRGLDLNGMKDRLHSKFSQ